MTKKKKNLRICTIKDYPDNVSKEWIEIDESGFMYWKADDYSELFFSQFIPSIKDPKIISASFVVDLDFVKEFFQRANRELEVDKLPANVKFDPYSVGIR
jgi:hypothetical protein